MMQYSPNTSTKKRERRLEKIVKNHVSLIGPDDGIKANQLNDFQMQMSMDTLARLYDLQSGYAYSDSGDGFCDYDECLYICHMLTTVAENLMPNFTWISKSDEIAKAFHTAFPDHFKKYDVSSSYFTEWVRPKVLKALGLTVDSEGGDFEVDTETQGRSKILNFMTLIDPHKQIVFILHAEQNS